MKILIEPKDSYNYIATIAIGESTYTAWEQFAYPTWEIYCKKNRVGLIVFDEDILSKGSENWKKATWQKLLIGKECQQSGVKVENICYLDTDILINPFAPNVFINYNPVNFSLVSLRKNLPFPYMETLKRVAFYRNKYYNNSYPLDSALFISINDLYAYHNLFPQNDEACMGFFIFNVEHHTELMYSWFNKYSSDVTSISNNGDQTHLNFEIQNSGKVTWLDYKYQAIWVFEMAWHYPFLYSKNDTEIDLILDCVETSLQNNYFLHFAGSWPESAMWKKQNVFSTFEKKILIDHLAKYQKEIPTGKPLGTLKFNNAISEKTS